jgi:hypothetical protein
MTDKVLEMTNTGVFILDKELVVVSSIIDDFADDNRDHAMICCWFDSDWSHELIDDNSICRVIVVEEPRSKILSIGVDGRVDVDDADLGMGVEHVDKSDRRPNYSETLRCAKVINGYVYAAGMARQIYRRNGPDDWIQFDDGIFIPRGERQYAAGILDIDGINNELYAVGYKGEIWYFNGKNWEHSDSPTDIALTKVICVGDIVYIVGLCGIIIKGRHNLWEIVEQDITKDDFWGIASFMDRTYVAAYSGVYEISANEFTKVDFKLDVPVSTEYLDARDGVIWSVGEKDIVMSENGVKWVKLPNP